MRWLAGALFFWVSVAAAAEPVDLAIGLGIESCPDVSQKEVARALAAELGVKVAAEAAEPITLVSARCEGTRMVLDVTDPVSRKTLRRRFDLGSAPARSRLVAIAASELVLASWAELEINPTLRVEPEGEPASPGTKEAARRRLPGRVAPATPAPPRAPPKAPPKPEPPKAEIRGVSVLEPGSLRLVGLASVRGFVAHPGALWGGGIRVGQQPLTRLSWAVDTLYESGDIEVSDGRLKTDTWTMGGQLFYTGGTEQAQGRVGAGVRAGMVATRPSGEVPSGRAVAPWGWPFAAVSATLRKGAFAFDVSAEGGYGALPVGGGSTGITLTGVWLSAQLGLGVVL